jgi:glutamate decarboxylase
VRPHINHNVAQLLGRDIIGACKYLEEHGGTASAPTLHGHAAAVTGTVKC